MTDLPNSLQLVISRSERSHELGTINEKVFRGKYFGQGLIGRASVDPERY